MSDVVKPQLVPVPQRPKLGWVAAWRTLFANYATVLGRASVCEFWLTAPVAWLTLILVPLVLLVLDPQAHLVFAVVVALTLVLALFVAVPLVAVTIRRLHDVNKSGWWALLYLLALVGMVVLAVWCAKPSDPRGVRFDDPHGRQPVIV